MDNKKSTDGVTHDTSTAQRLEELRIKANSNNVATKATSPVKIYEQADRWLQDAATKAGMGKHAWPPKPSIKKAEEVVSSFLSYQKITAGVLEHFMDSYLQFEKTGRTFPTEHALTQMIMNDSASRSVPLPDQNMIAFVSTSPDAVSSDALFLRTMLQSLASGAMENTLAPNVTASVQTGRENNQSANLSAQAGIGSSIFSIFKASANAEVEIRNEKQKSSKVLVTGKINIDAEDRRVLSCLSAIYALEQSGVLPQKKFLNTLITLSEIASSKTGNEADDLECAESWLTNPKKTVDHINNAVMMSAHISKFMVSFCADHLRMAREKDEESPETDFWIDALRVFRSGDIRGREISSLIRYADNQDQAEPYMAISMLRMLDVMTKTRKAASTFLFDKRTDIWKNAYSSDSIPVGTSIDSISLSPVIGDNVLVVQVTKRGKLKATIKSIGCAAKIFTGLEPFITEYTKGRYRIKIDQWDNALQAVNKINNELMESTVQGKVYSVEEDAEGNKFLEMKEQPDTPSLDDLLPDRDFILDFNR